MLTTRKKEREAVRFLRAGEDRAWINTAQFETYIKGRKTDNFPTGSLWRQNLCRPPHESTSDFIKSESLLNVLYFPVALKLFPPIGKLAPSLKSDASNNALISY